MAERTGTVGGQFTLPGGQHISVINYTLTNGAQTYTGTIDVSASSTISFVIAGVAAGDGYVITITATSDDGTVDCSGSEGPFSVAGRATTTVNVPVQCMLKRPDAGSVLVNGVASNCAVWNTIVADPASAGLAPPDNTVTLYAAATGPDPASVTFSWSVASGTGTVNGESATLTSDGTGKTATAIFSCPKQAEDDTIVLVVSDGPVPDGGGCPASYTTATLTVRCSPSAPCPGCSALVPCTQPGQPNCVQCRANTGGGGCF